MRRIPVLLGVMAVLLIACVKTGPAVEPTATATATSVAPTSTPTPSPTATPTPIPTIPAWSPYQPDSATGWCWQAVIGQVNYLEDVFFWDAQTGWAVGERGTILHTDDGGQTWQWQTSPVTATLHQVDFVSLQTGWILGSAHYKPNHNAVLLKTDDGGATWIEQPLPFYGDDYVFLPEMAWPDARTGWLTIRDHVFRTDDGGQTWQEYTLPGQVYLWDFMIGVDSQHAWAAEHNSDTIIHTDDGGANWTVYPITATLLTGRFFLDDLAFVDAQHGWATSRDAVVHTTDGGRTWEVQLAFDREDWGYTMRASFNDAWTGWIWNAGGNLWRTTDGGVTWEKHTIPRGRQAVAFVDDRRIWAVGSWAEDERSTIAYTSDGGATWEMQDTHIETPPLAYAAAARLTSYVAQRGAPWAGLLPLLFPGHCIYENYIWLLMALHNLGWVEGTRWQEPLTPDDAGYQDLGDIFQRLDADVDEDGEDEVIILGGRCDFEMVAGVLDWDGARWQVAWVLHSFTRYNSDIRARVDDFDADGHPELLVETLRHPGSGTGISVQQWDAYLIRCAHLNCRTIWTKDVGYVGRAFSWLYLDYGWRGSNYRFDRSDSATSRIVMQTYGVDFTQTPITTDTVTATLTVLTSTQSIYLWDGAAYTLTSHAVLTPAYTLDVRPVTETLAGGLYTVHGWEANPDGLWQTLSIYDGDAISPTQVFTAAFTGAPGAGVWLQDADGDGQFEVMDCDTGFSLTFDLRFAEWASTLPECTIYQWDPPTRIFRNQNLPDF